MKTSVRFTGIMVVFLFFGIIAACSGGGSGPKNDIVTEPRMAPIVSSTAPANGATNVGVNTSIQVVFNQMVAASNIGVAITVTANGAAVSGYTNSNGATATFTPSNPLPYNSTVNVKVDTTYHDSENDDAKTYSCAFTTGQAPDTTLPTVTSYTPGKNDVNVPTNTSLVVTFSEAVDPSTVNWDNVKIVGVPGTVKLTGNTATFTPSAPLAYGITYTASVTSVKDLAGNMMAGGLSWGFTTGQAPDTNPPTVISVTPAANATDVATTAVLTATFSEAVDPMTINVNNVKIIGVQGTTSLVGNTATFTPSVPLAYDTTYTASVTSVKDLAGNMMAIGMNWGFKTRIAPDTTPPTLVSVTPAANATNVATTAVLTATFSEAVDPSTVNANNVKINGVSGTVSLAGNTATFTPSVPLAYDTTYSASVTSVKDLAGNTMSGGSSWTFTTEIDPTAPVNITGSIGANETLLVFQENALVQTITGKGVNAASVNYSGAPGNYKLIVQANNGSYVTSVVDSGDDNVFAIAAGGSMNLGSVTQVKSGRTAYSITGTNLTYVKQKPVFMAVPVEINNCKGNWVGTLTATDSNNPAVPIGTEMYYCWHDAQAADDFLFTNTDPDLGVITGTVNGNLAYSWFVGKDSLGWDVTWSEILVVGITYPCNGSEWGWTMGGTNHQTWQKDSSSYYTTGASRASSMPNSVCK